jgi:hypothetical protein
MSDDADARAAKRKARILAGGETRLKLVLGELPSLSGGVDPATPATAPARLQQEPPPPPPPPAAASPAPLLPASPDAKSTASPPSPAPRAESPAAGSGGAPARPAAPPAGGGGLRQRPAAAAAAAAPAAPLLPLSPPPPPTPPAAAPPSKRVASLVRAMRTRALLGALHAALPLLLAALLLLVTRACGWPAWLRLGSGGGGAVGAVVGDALREEWSDPAGGGGGGGGGSGARRALQGVLPPHVCDALQPLLLGGDGRGAWWALPLLVGLRAALGRLRAGGGVPAPPVGGAPLSPATAPAVLSAQAAEGVGGDRFAAVAGLAGKGWALWTFLTEAWGDVALFVVALALLGPVLGGG